ncbi:sterigmatocystin biosynthesis monooxygenase stcW [Hyphodiscus hymeniophilus]|uniref:Sterigmatocystin biosynthesis monooxygenase stcW n=1 Tax=Hyphodiscus hymeniophilus TaxID=353542 RepID=A0A9P6VR55_9HELO|nr:sterigmatocystin biosynthesis monooxygenase stcW [Hyphodiscus hymeniophilus]
MAPSYTEPQFVSESQIAIPDIDTLPDKFGWPRENANGYRIKEQLCGTERPLRVVHIGAGASGICLAKFLPEALNNVSLTCYDKNGDVGGTWLENNSHGQEIQIGHISTLMQQRSGNRFDLQKYMTLSHEVTGCFWDDERGVWEVHVKNLLNGTIKFEDEHQFLSVPAHIRLSNWKWPEIQGLHGFKGKLCHTANYDTSIDLDQKRAAVIGVGSSGIQLTSKIATQVGHLYTWVRSPTWITAGFAQNHAGPNGANFECKLLQPLQDTPEQKKNFAENPLEYQNYCKQIEDELNQRFKFILNGTPEAEGARKFSTQQMKDRLNGREDLIQKIIPTTFGVGCRRPTPGNGFLEALTLPNVTTFTQEMQRITPRGFIDHEGKEHEVDIIICATGFDTTWVPRFPIVARGKNVQDLLRARPLSYLAIAVPEIPNYWTGIGPYGPLGHGSFLPICELLSRHLVTIIKKLQVENIKSLTPRLDVSEAFAEHADLFLKRTAWSGKCVSWFKQGRLDGTLCMFPGSRLVYFDLLSSPRYEDYRIEYQGGNPFGFLGNGFHLMEHDGSDLSYYLGTNEKPGKLLPQRDTRR